MKKTIKALWNGTIYGAQACQRDGTLSAELQKDAEALGVQLKEMLTEKGQKELLALYADAMDDARAAQAEKAFACGFRLGVRLVCESMAEEDV